MTKKEVKKELEVILRKVGLNTIEAWHANLESTVPAACMDNYYGDAGDSDMVTVRYNGWLEDLLNLKDKL